MLTSIEVELLESLIAETRPAESGMEKHFARVMRGQAMPCTEKEIEWYGFWQRNKSEHFSAPLPQASTNPAQPSAAEEAKASPVRMCVDCGLPIPRARLLVSPEVMRCIRCQNNFESVHDTTRKIDEGLAGTREAHKRMRGQLRTDMRNRGRVE
jgi:hypothetical protein